MVSDLSRHLAGELRIPTFSDVWTDSWWNGTPTALEIDGYGAESVSWQRLPDSIESCWNEHAVEEDQDGYEEAEATNGSHGKGHGHDHEAQAEKEDLAREVARRLAEVAEADPGERWMKECRPTSGRGDDRRPLTNRRCSGPLGEERRNRSPLLGG